MARSRSITLSVSPPDYIEPCLPTLVRKPPTGERWIHEIKHDGYRLAVRIDSGAVRLITRRGLDWTERFPLVHHAASELGLKSAYIDGEVVIEAADGISDWAALHACAASGRCDQGTLWAFDLLFLDGEDLRMRPLIERKAALAAELDQTGNIGIRYVEHLEVSGPLIFAKACEMGLEGVVSKLRDSKYRSGRTDTWQKVKCQQEGQFIVVGFLPNSISGGAVGALILGRMEGGQLVRAGKVGTGWDTRTARELAAALETIRQDSPPFAAALSRNEYRGAKWVRPIVSVNISYRGLSRDGILRHPSFKGVANVANPDL